MDYSLLEDGPAYFFRDWPNPEVPRVCAGVYTVWRGMALLYAGMAGRSLSAEQIAGHRQAASSVKGLYSRLDSHAQGRRSGDQFCVYVCDRLVLPGLTQLQILQIADGGLSLDRLVREYIRAYLSYRFLETADSASALEIERAVRSGTLKAGKPLLNPVR